MIKELCYEWVLFCAYLFLVDRPIKGFYDSKRLYKKNSFLDWEIKKIEEVGE